MESNDWLSHQRKFIFGRDWSVANPPESRVTQYIRGFGEPNTNPLTDLANDNLDVPDQVVEETPDAWSPAFARLYQVTFLAATMPLVAL